MKRLFPVLLILSLALLLTACGCKHEWAEATCTTAKTCTLCEEVEGEPLGHSWADATCEAPKSCSGCGLTEGEALGHDWVDATCETPKSCSQCTLTEGEALGHSWNNATCAEKKICAACNFASGEFGPHMDIENIGKEGDNVRILCKCGQEEVLSAEALMLRLLQGKWTLRVVQKGNGIYRPDPETYWNESTWLEFPSANEPIGYEVGASDLVASVVVPQELLNFTQTSAMMYTNGPEIPVLSCTARSDYGENAYIDTPLILTIGNRNYLPEDYTDEDFITSSLNGTVLSLWRFNADGLYLYHYDAE